ncbi:hypothetical protein OMCYN_00991 [cyanobiont of Ornithocercus magnificus]|nr:hypothetical protein OMCYN_00991 [cyanobiont of Ornithocercus magnificus]
MICIATRCYSIVLGNNNVFKLGGVWLILTVILYSLRSGIT